MVGSIHTYPVLLPPFPWYSALGDRRFSCPLPPHVAPRLSLTRLPLPPCDVRSGPAQRRIMTPHWGQCGGAIRNVESVVKSWQLRQALRFSLLKPVDYQSYHPLWQREHTKRAPRRYADQPGRSRLLYVYVLTVPIWINSALYWALSLLFGAFTLHWTGIFLCTLLCCFITFALCTLLLVSLPVSLVHLPFYCK